MKSLLACLLLLTAAHVDAADPITLQDTLCGTGTTATCSNPAPNVSVLSYNPTYQRLTVTIDGIQYDSGAYRATAQGATVYAADGTYRVVQTTFVNWQTLVRSGHNFYITHWELKDGSVR